MATASQIINKAKSYIGYKESPPNSNSCIFNRDYYGYNVSGDAYPWCCTFVWDIFRMCGASNLFYGGNKTASCTAVLNWGRNNNLIVKNGQKGDLILFDWDGSGDADHIGFIEENNGDGTYTTIEGNTAIGNDSNGGEVMERKRGSCIRAIIRPKYEKENLMYRAYVQGTGYMPWSNDGEVAGTTGQGKRMEAIQFSKDSQITATCHCQSYGDMNPVLPANICGTVGESLRMESIKLEAPYKIEYRVHQQGIGWTKWYSNGEWAGTKGQSKRLEAIQVRRV